MPILPGGTSPMPTEIGGSPRGWTFISMAAECTLEWANRYVFGLLPVVTPEYFDLGSAYHALQEGKALDEVKVRYPAQAAEAQRLFEVRAKGPPMPPLHKVVAEKEFPIIGGRMTSKPDRVEKSGSRHIVRDFKTTFMFSQYDEQVWGIDGGILGECIAGDTDTALVDIVTKREDAKVTTKMVTVKLTPDKRHALEAMVAATWKDIEARTKVLAKFKNPTLQNVVESFPRNLKGCVNKYGPCAYYARCWEKGTVASMMYRRLAEPPRRWADYVPAISWRKQLDLAYERAKGVV